MLLKKLKKILLLPHPSLYENEKIYFYKLIYCTLIKTNKVQAVINYLVENSGYLIGG